ncbi:hypothetical protein [Rickettsia endosymbiont of Orchestes rusci]|uniref:hypothetical protein n=1 Tax=Rickettsia endosymbiont of Orchestes rusci TaxID=3066250 RepID=UPI00313D5C28
MNKSRNDIVKFAINLEPCNKTATKGVSCMANNYRIMVIISTVSRKILIKRPDAVVKQLDDTETLCKNSSHATTPRFHGNDIPTYKYV